MVKRIKHVERDKLNQTLKTLQNTTAKVGYFADQGKHHSGMNYPSLMYLHEVKGVRSALLGTVRRRPFEIAMTDDKDKLMHNLQSRLARSISRLQPTHNAIEITCEEMEKSVKSIFGDTGKLQPNAESTVKIKGFNAPLIETSELKDKLTHRINQKGK